MLGCQQLYVSSNLSIQLQEYCTHLCFSKKKKKKEKEHIKIILYRLLSFESFSDLINTRKKHFLQPTPTSEEKESKKYEMLSILLNGMEP